MVYKKDEHEVIEKKQENIYNITFKKKRTKSNIRFGAKLLVYLIIAATSGVVFSNIMINVKYGNIIREINEYASDEMIISDYTKIVDIVSPSIVTISDSEQSLLNKEIDSKNTTGIILDEEGSILTNYSTVKEFENIKVKLSSIGTQTFSGKLIVKSEDIDVAIIKIECEEKLKPIKFASRDSLRVGQSIAILGNTSGSDYIDNVSPGIITSKGEEILSGRGIQEVLQVSAPINSANTGGPICNSKGEVIGLASSYLSEMKEDNKFYYGIKLKDLESIKNSTNAFKGILGVVEGGILSGVENEFKGFYVQELDEEGNAYKAGIKPTDIILEIDDSKFISIEEATINIQKKKNGDIIKCKVLKEGEVKIINVKIEQ